LMIAAFMLFSTPTPPVDFSANDADRSAISHLTDGLVKFPARNYTDTAIKVFLQVPFLFFATWLVTLVRPFPLPEVRLPFLPLISKRLRNLFLLPLKFTSLFVAVPTSVN
jgi:hypothetical protein